MPQAPAVFKMAGVFILCDPVFGVRSIKNIKPKIYKINGNPTEQEILPLL